jgi:hypothetical protein
VTETNFERIYIAGPMRGIPYFNSPEFDRVAGIWRAVGYVKEVCNPCDHDRDVYGPEIFNSPTGDVADIAHLGFDHVETLLWDLDWIARKATTIVCLPGWRASTGATAEVALALALGKTVIESDK